MQEDNKLTYTAKFPLYCVDVKKDYIIVGGGGGASKTGIGNGVILLSLKSKKTKRRRGEVAPETDEKELTELHYYDTKLSCINALCFHPMKYSFAVGLDTSVTLCSIYDGQITPTKSVDLKSSFNEDEWVIIGKSSSQEKKQSEALEWQIKCLRFNVKGDSLAVGTTNGNIHLLEFPSLKIRKTFTDKESPTDEIDRITINSTLIAAATQYCIKIWQLNQKECDTCLHRIPIDSLYKNRRIVYRGIRFDPAAEGTLYIGRSAPGMRSWIDKWSTSSDIHQVSSKIAHRYSHHNVLELSGDGQLIATGTSEQTVGVFRADNLAKQMEPKPHAFFVTGVCFTPDSKYVISISADYTCVVTPVKLAKGVMNNTSLMIIISLIVLLLAIVLYYVLM